MTRDDEDPDDEDVILDDPEQEEFLRRLDAAKGAFLRGLAIGVPTWLLLLAVVGAAAGPSLGGFLVATVLTVAVVLLFERRRGSGRGLRVTPRGVAVVGVAIIVALVWILFVTAVSR